MGSLLTSQQLLRTGSPVIEGSKESIQADGYSWQIRPSKGQLLYAYPQGTSVLSVPAVAIANLLGYDMRNIHHQAATQKALAILTFATITALLYAFAKTVTRPLPSAIIAFTFALGTTLASSVAIAYWNFNLEVIFLILSIFLLTKVEQWKSPRLPILFGTLLFLAFFCRPTAAPFIAVSLSYLVFYYRKHFLLASIAAGIPFLLHTWFSLHFYGSLTPGHHHFSALEFGSRLAEGIAGTTISPSKGLFVNSPILVFAFLAPLFLWKRNALAPLDLFIFCGLLLHIFAISSWGMWWGGGSFASRLATDALPGYFYLLLRFVQATNLPETFASLKRPALIFLVTTAALFSVFVHTTQGAFNPWTERFNNDPLIGPMETDHFFNWNFPQFLASKSLLKKRSDYLFEQKAETQLRHLKDALGETLHFGKGTDASKLFIRSGFYSAEETGRWLSDTEATFFLKLDLQDSDSDLTLEIDATYFGESEPVTLSVDQNKIGHFDLLKENLIKIPNRLLDSTKKIHRFDIKTNEGRSPLELGISQDARVLKLWLTSLRIVEN